MREQKAILIVVLSVALLALILGLFFSSVFRRVHHKRKYRRLDALREFYGKKLAADLNAGGAGISADEYRAYPGSLEWRAVEDVLFQLMEDERYRGEVKRLFTGLGYVVYYEDHIMSINKIERESAIDKLGKTGHAASTPKLIPLLDETDPDVLAVAVRALSRLGSREGLLAIVEKLPHLLGQSLVAGRTIETALLNFGPASVPVLIERHAEHPEPRVVATALEILSHFAPESRAVFLAIEHVNDQDPEVRSRALKVLARAGKNIPEHLSSLVVPLLSDPVWYVRLQATKAAGALRSEEAAAPLGRMLFDENWQVRGGAALALTGFGDAAIDVFHDALTQLAAAETKRDVCAEIEKTGFTRRLIENLAARDVSVRTKSREVLSMMHLLGFSASLAEYARSGEDGQARQAVREILGGGEGR